MKRCRTCGEEKPLTDFYLEKRKKDGRRANCKDCHKSYVADRYAADPERYINYQKVYRQENALQIRKQHRCYKFGITPEEHDQIIERAQGRCEICGGEKTLHMDHDHRSGKVRGMLCDHCNHGLGKFRDDPVLLLNAAKYLTS